MMVVDPKLLLSSDKLPSLPAAAVKVLAIASSPEPDLKKLIEVIKCDPALAAKILRATNSSLFGFRQSVTAIEQAVPLLGTILVRTLVLSFSLTNSAIQPGPFADYYRGFWRSALTQAVAAESLANHDGGGVPAEYFVAGLLQDVGVLALLRAMPDAYLPVLQEHDNSDKSLAAIEQERLGFSHVEVSVELCRRWRLADSVQEAIALHHATADELARAADANSARLSAALATAAAIGDYFCRARKSAALGIVHDLTMRFYGIEPDALHQLLFGVDRRVRESAELFALDLGSCPSYDEILVQANAELAAIAVEAQMASLRAGAQARAAQRMISELEDQKEQFRNQAYSDYLSGIYNRHFFERVVELEHNRCTRYSETLGLIFLDLDEFKRLNDTYGHPFGDCVLKTVAQSIVNSVRNSDIVARFGGDEFVVLLLRVTKEDLIRTAERVRESIGSIRLSCRDEEITVSASLGAALWDPKSSTPPNPSQLIEAADAAMYEAKRLGGNQIRFVEWSGDKATVPEELGRTA